MQKNEFKDDVAYNSVHLLKVRAEFEVMIVSCMWSRMVGSPHFDVMGRMKGEII